MAPLLPGELDCKRNELVYEKLKKDIAYYKTLGLSLSDMIELIKRTL